MDRNPNPPQMDESILGRARRGDQDAMRRLYDETKSYAWFIANRYLRNAADVEDVLQEVYVTVFMKLDTFDGGHFKAWVHRIVTNKCLNFIRNQKLIFASVEEAEDLADGNEETIPSEWLERAEKRRDIIRIIDALPPSQRMAVTMFYLEGLPVAEIAEVMGITAGAVKNFLYTGRQAIKADVLLEEKKDNKLYSLVPVPLLTQLFELEAETAVIPEAVSEAVWNGTINRLAASGMLSGTSAAGTAGATVKTGLGAKFASLSGGVKTMIIAGIVAAVIAAVGIPAYLIAAGTPPVHTGDITPSPSLLPTETQTPDQLETLFPTDSDDQVISTGSETAPPSAATSTTAIPESAAPTTAIPATIAPETATPAPETPSTAPTATTAPASATPSTATDNELYNAIANLPRSDAVDILWDRLRGYWTAAGDQFAGFITIDGTPGIYYGLYQSSFGGRGKITDARAVSASEAALTIYIPAIPEDHMDGPQPERTETVYIDISNLDANRLNVKIENLGGGGWRTYIYGGDSLEGAF